jgi:hypothetical protein
MGGDGHCCGMARGYAGGARSDLSNSIYTTRLISPPAWSDVVSRDPDTMEIKIDMY